jgi:hypothetical protein
VVLEINKKVLGEEDVGEKDDFGARIDRSSFN